MSVERMTRKQIVDTYGAENLYKVPYCGLQHLLNHCNRTGYNCGSLGWNYDVYPLSSDCVIVTGYRVSIGKELPYSFYSAWDDLARERFTNCHYKEYDETKESIIAAFVEMCTHV